MPPFLATAGRTVTSIRLPPPAVLALAYGGLILAGALLLLLPQAATAPTGWYDALFTAASAVTVTGLAVVDTGTHFTVFGQAVIMVLIQLGGLGLMTFAVMVLALLGMRIGLRHRLILREDLNQTSFGDLMRLVAAILRVVIAFEFAGTVALAIRWVPEFGWRHGLWAAAFHAVSAFNNAGFALWPDNLVRWAGDPVVNLAIPVLFIVGGLGYSVLTDLWTHRRWRPLSLHSKLMLSGTAVLIVLPFLAILGLEWSNPATLGGLDPGTRVWAAWFQSVTTRTAGFNTIDVAGLHDATTLMMISLMLVGGGSTSTAGGIKVTTLAVLLLATVAFFRRHSAVSVFGRSLGRDDILKVLAITVMSLLATMTGIFLVTLTNEGHFLDLVFEVASALGTVGLSRGATAELDPFGRGVVMVLMFIGRIGPLALGFFLATRTPPRIRYPTGRVYLG